MQPIDASGVWWLPTSPEHRVVGTLTFDSASGFRLSIPAGALGSQQEMVERLNRMGALGSSLIGDVLGVLKDGRCITLFDCHNSGFSLSAPGMTSESYMALRGSVGRTHVGGTAETARVRIQTTLLRDWVGESDLTIEVSFGEDDRPTGAIAVKREPVDERLLFDTAQLRACLTHVGGFTGDPTHGVMVNHDCRLEIELKHHLPVESVVETVVAPVAYFLTFAMGCPIGIETLEVSAAPETDWCELYFTHLGVREAPERRLDPWMLIPLFSTHADAALLFANWLALDGDLRHAAVLTADLASQRSGTVNYRLLLAAQALESVHRARMDRQEIPQHEFKSRLSAALSACEDKRTRAWMKRKLQYSNIKPLETQLRELYAYAGPAARRIAPDRDRFLGDLRKSRNFFAHGGDLDDAPVDLADVDVLTDAATQLLRALVLRELGLRPEEALVLLDDDQGFVQACVHTARLYALPAPPAG